MKFAMHKDWLTLSPTFARIDGFMFYFVMADLNEPSHAHVGEGKTPLSSDGKIWLDTLTIATPGRLSAHQMRRALKIAEENQAAWLEIWRTYATNRR
jgi:hypothetical protein